VSELGDEFFVRAKVTKPGESLIEKMESSMSLEAEKELLAQLTGPTAVADGEDRPKETLAEKLKRRQQIAVLKQKISAQEKAEREFKYLERAMIDAADKGECYVVHESVNVEGDERAQVRFEELCEAEGMTATFHRANEYADWTVTIRWVVSEQELFAKEEGKVLRGMADV
jgi:hypothetical protein